MAVRKINNSVYNIGTIDWDRQSFDELIPLPDGTSYNSYVIFGSEKTAVVDGVDTDTLEEYIVNLNSLGVKKVDYIISNHTEQDHSGTIVNLLEIYPDAKVVTNKKCRDFLVEHLLLSEEVFITIEDGDKLSLGDKTLSFIIAPWVHWPETMFTYLEEDKCLFPCDFLGSHLATNETFSKDDGKIFDAAKRYYAEIMMPFRIHIRKHLDRLKSFEIDYVCPSHGPAFSNPKFIIDAYEEWISDSYKNKVLIPYVSMHGSVKAMVDYMVNGLTEKGIKVELLNMTKKGLGELAIDAVDAATVVFGVSTMLIGPHPTMLYTAAIVNALKPKTKFVSLVGSYGWGSKAFEIMEDNLKNVKAEMLTKVLAKGFPKKEDFEKLDILISEIQSKHKELGIL